MMTRSQLDTIRARLGDGAHLHPDDAHEIALELYEELERVRLREALERVNHLQLVRAAQATIAATNQRDAHPTLHLEHMLSEQGQLPAAGNCPSQILASPADLTDLMPG